MERAVCGMKGWREGAVVWVERVEGRKEGRKERLRTTEAHENFTPLNMVLIPSQGFTDGLRIYRVVAT
jgi:hypothetical protein